MICDPATEAAIFTTWGRPVLFPYLSQIPGAHRVQLIGADPAAPDPDWVSMMMGSVAERLPQARFDVIPHRGHLWPFEAPEAVLHWISTTLLA
ncbi:MAG: hypothetical protein J0M17_08255 [Planctomycetes bacterium]|nr:hypothetical protein [Planctomycetota bacterium]